MPEVQNDEEGNPVVVEYTDEQIDDMEDIPFDDKVLTFETQKDGKKIWVFNHLAAKTLRDDLAKEFKNAAEKLETVDQVDFNFRMEKEAAAFEEKFTRLFSEDSQSNAPKVPVFTYRPDM